MEYKLSINGLREYAKTLTPPINIFSRFALPVVRTAAQLGIPADQYVDEATKAALTIDSAVLFDRICLDTLPFSCVYSSPEVLQSAIGIWSETYLPKWQSLYNTLFYRFNPLWNKDATHTENNATDTTNKINRASTANDRTTYTSSSKDRNTDLVRSYEDGNVSIQLETPIARTATLNRNPGGTVTVEQTDDPDTDTDHDPDTPERDITKIEAEVAVTSGDQTTITNVNPPPDAEHPSTLITSNYTPSGVQDLTHNLQSINQFDHSFTDSQANTEYERGNLSWREYGNIGVTSTQELIERSRKLALFNIYDIIIADFIRYFCIMIY